MLDQMNARHGRSKHLSGRFQNVSFSLSAARKHQFTDLNLSVERGETLVLLGESGCGKTTTLKLVNRLLSRRRRGSS